MCVCVLAGVEGACGPVKWQALTLSRVWCPWVPTGSMEHISHLPHQAVHFFHLPCFLLTALHRPALQLVALSSAEELSEKDRLSPQGQMVGERRSHIFMGGCSEPEKSQLSGSALGLGLLVSLL